MPRFFKTTDEAVAKTIARLEERLTHLHNLEYLLWMRGDSHLENIQNAIDLSAAQLATLKNILQQDQQIEFDRLNAYENMSITLSQHVSEITQLK